MSELTEEQKRRIEQEERARVAEETYRQEVRRNLSSSALMPSLAVDKRPAPVNWLRVGIIAIVAILFVGAWVALVYRRPIIPDNLSGPTVGLSPIWVPVTEQLVTGQFQVPAQNYRLWTITVPPGTRNFQVTGHYSAIGGSGNDIAAVVATEEQFQNWINGHESRIFYASPGKVTTGEIDIKGLPPGRYVLAFSNKFSVLTAKAVEAEISTSYEHLK